MLRSVFLASLVALPTTATAARADAPPAAVTVFAAASLREAFEAAAPAFTKKTGFAVTFDFGGSDSLEQQIAAGAPADVFASANEVQMRKAVAAGLIDGTPRTFARNRLVALVPKANPGHVASVADMARPGLKVVLAASAVPVGDYARTTFRKLDGRDGFANDFAAAVERNVVSNELDVKAVATKVSLGEGDVGVVYATDVTPSIAAGVRELTFPAGAVPDISYPIAALKNARNAAGAKAFVDFAIAECQTELRARGFLAP